MAILKDVVKELVDIFETISGIRYAPDEPPENTNDQFPFLAAWPLTGTYTQGPATVMKGLHDVNIELHVARKDLPRDYSAVMDLIDEIPYRLMQVRKDGGLSQIATFGAINYTFGSMEYAGVLTLGARYTITDVKVERNIT